jgi:hypothetical protein
MFIEFCPAEISGLGMHLPNDHHSHKQSNHLFFAFLNVVVCLGFELFSCLLFFLLSREALEFFFYSILALVSFTLAFS